MNLATLTGGKHTSIRYLTSKSRKNMITYLDELKNVFHPNYIAHLTYPANYLHDGVNAKKNLTDLYNQIVGAIHYKAVDPDIVFFWKMEFQQRGAPHFHILVQSSLGWKELLEAFNKIWLPLTFNADDHGVKLERIRNTFEAEMYISLHFSKESQNFKPHDFRNPGRFWGIRGKNILKARQEVWDASDEGKRQAILQAAYDNAVEDEIAFRKELISSLEEERTEENAKLVQKLVAMASAADINEPLDSPLEDDTVLGNTASASRQNIKCFVLHP